MLFVNDLSRLMKIEYYLPGYIISHTLAAIHYSNAFMLLCGDLKKVQSMVCAVDPCQIDGEKKC